MSEYGERPFRKPGTNTAAGRAKKVEKTKNQVASAQAKRAMVVYALERMERLGITKKQAFAMVKQAVRKGELEGPAPSQSSFYRMMSKAEQMDGLPNVKAFIARQKDGRPPHEWHPDLEARFLQMVRSGAYKGPAAIFRDLRPWAEERGFDPLPTVWTVRRHWENLDVAEIAAAVHGARAAVADAIPHGTVPVTYTHELWTLDETEIPVWIQAYDPVKREMVSVKPWVIFVTDNRSRAIVAYHVVEPFRKGFTSTHDSDDVLGAFLSAAVPGLGPEACARFSGFLPTAVRLDEHQSHNDLRRRLRENGVDAPDLPGYRPYARGSVESLIGTMKRFFEGAHGHVDQWLPADRVREDPKKTRSVKAADNMRRERRKIIRDVSDLLTYDEFLEELEKRVRSYHARKHRMLEEPPEVAYHRHLNPRKLRSGEDAVLMMDVTHLRVQRGGIDWRNTYFEARVNGERLQVGQSITCWTDPLKRGLFVQRDGVFYRLLPNSEASKLRTGESVALEMQSEARELSDDADAALRMRQEDQIAERNRRRSKKAPDVLPEDLVALRMDGDDDLESIEESSAIDMEKVSGEKLSRPRPRPKASRAKLVEEDGDTTAERPKPRGLVKSRLSHIRLVTE